MPLLFTENDTNTQRIFGTPNQSAYVKDGINDAIVGGRDGAVNPDKTGTIVAAHYRLTIGPGESTVVRLRLSDVEPAALAAAKGARRRAHSATRSIGGRQPSAGGGRVLRHDHSGVIGCRRRERHAASAGRNVVVQAVLPLRRASVAQGARFGSVQSDAQGGAAQRPMASHVQRGRHLDAGQVGVSLVRGLGSRIPCAGADARGSRLRQAAAQAPAAGALHAPQWPVARLRVELRRRQSSRACLRHDLHLSSREGADRSGRHRVAGELLSQAAAELRLVGESRGPDRTQRLRRRLPGPRQHQPVRPQRSAADRRAIWSSPTAPPG